jgi:hypothetical protein
MEEEQPNLESESIPIDAPEGDFCLSVTVDLRQLNLAPEFPVKRQEVVIGFQCGKKVVRVDTRDPITGQPIWQRMVLV